MEKLIRIIHPETRIVDSARGIVDYVASDETVDSFKEVIRANGWRFNNFKKNAPFVNSHQYDSIEHLVGKVIDFKVTGGKLINRVQWAVDVPENKLAQIGWKMTEAGYLKAVSVGFWPVKSVSRWDQNKRDYLQQLEELGLKEEDGVRTIYIEHEQVELSAVVLGANPNALAKACQAGAITESDYDFVLQRSGQGAQAKTSVFFPSQKTTSTKESTMQQRTNFLNDFDRLTAETKGAFEKLTRAKNGGSAEEFFRALRSVVLHRRLEQRLAGDPFAPIVEDAELNFRLNALVRHAAFGRSQADKIPEKYQRAISEDATPGAALVRDRLGTMLYDILLRYGKWATLNVQPTLGKGIRYPIVTAEPNAAFILTQGAEISDDTTAAGTSASGDFGTIASYVNMSMQLVEDADADLSLAFLQLFERAFNKRLDVACFNGTGVADADNGGITGIFQHADPALAVAASGNTTVQNLEFEDFVRTVNSSTAAVLQRTPRWWMHPAFLPSLFVIKDSGGRPLLTTAREAPSGTIFSILGFPVELTAAAPSTDAAGSKIAAFGDGLGYGVGLRKEFVLEESRHARFNFLQVGVRSIGRARGDMLRASAFAILKTAAE